MTKYEKLALEMVTGLMGAVAALTAANGAKSELMSLHLPNLSPEEREELQDDIEIQLERKRAAIERECRKFENNFRAEFVVYFRGLRTNWADKLY
jgi:predicted aconitase